MSSNLSTSDKEVSPPRSPLSTRHLGGPLSNLKSTWSEDNGSTGDVSESSDCVWSSHESNTSSTSCTPLSSLRGTTWSSVELQNALHFARSHRTSNVEHTSSTGSFSLDAPCEPPPSSTRMGLRPTPDASPPHQPKMLKQINGYQTKEELLDFVSSSHNLLDEINLVTCIYRLARMHNNIRNPAARQRWSYELQNSVAFTVLLRTIQSHLIQAQLELMRRGSFKGFDARCISNLIWAIVKLELATEAGGYGNELVQNVSPLVLHFLPNSSSQGLANLLWAYSKMPAPLLDVMMMIVSEMSIRLQNQEGHFDAQALSNGIWALAHIRSKVPDLDSVAGTPGLTGRFMQGIASCSLNLLRTLQTRSDLMHMQASMMEAERRFSCQALVNICWSFASILGADCSKIPSIRSLFGCIRAEALTRLRATASALQLNQAWIFRLQGGFNEQALSNIVYAFDKAQMLDREVLQSVYAVAVLRLERSYGQPTFKPQELCTLLRAAQSNIAQPWAFLSKLQATLVSRPQFVQEWSASERAELDRAMGLLEMYRTSVMLQQMQKEQQKLAVHYASHLHMPNLGGASGHTIQDLGSAQQ